MHTAIVTDPIYKEHLTGFAHPESPERYEIITHALKAEHLQTPQNTFPPRMAKKEDILLCHTLEYYNIVEQDLERAKKQQVTDGSWTLCTGDVQVCPKSWKVAHLAVGGVLTAIDLVAAKKSQNAFCIIRPPGHHATKNKGMGFCIFNNVAIGARYVQKKYKISKVLIVDWDVHHGNGTQDIFELDSSVFYFSTHQWPHYPGTGSSSEKGQGNILNFPISATPRSRIEVLSAFLGPLTKAMEIFRPEFIFISAGFDAHKKDPLGGFNLEDADFRTLTEIVLDIGKKYAQGRVVSVLEGGYHLDVLASASVSHVTALNSNISH